MKHIRSFLTLDTAKTIGCSIVGSRLDYANSLLYNTSQHNLNKLQRIQNTLARVVLNSRHSSSYSTNLQSLHWLPVKQRITYKLATLAFRSINRTSPAYLTSLIQPYTPARHLRSSDSHLLATPRVNLSLTKQSFGVSAPSVWNSLPTSIRAASTYSSFCTSTKTHLFRQAFP